MEKRLKREEYSAFVAYSVCLPQMGLARTVTGCIIRKQTDGECNLRIDVKKRTTVSLETRNMARWLGNSAYAVRCNRNAESQN